jgi:acyl-CoA reductase-like NAD-dependent aldehyde dehydrogenase
MKNTNADSRRLESINPATGESLGEVIVTSPGNVPAAVCRARTAFPGWRDLGLERRSQILKKAQQILLERNEEFARSITLEMGRPLVESLVVEVEASVDLIGYYAGRSRRFLSDRRLSLHNVFFIRKKSYVHHQPLGVMAVIAPWNWPLLIPLGCIVPALLAGNTVVFKPSELTPLVGQKIGELFTEAGVPEGALIVMQGAGDIGEALVGSEADKVFFTGSTEVGQRIMQKAASSLKKAVLEMGGSDPAIVCDDADLDIASSGILWGGMTNCGQNCNGIERVIVHQQCAKEFLDRLAEKLKKLRIGDGMDTQTDIGPLASHAQLKKMEAVVERSLRLGAKRLTGGHRIKPGNGYFFEPTLLYFQDPGNLPTDEEIFGPILTIAEARDDDHAIHLANRSVFGLAASVWTTNKRRGERIAKRLQSGTVMINDVLVSFGMTEVCWTGVKKSGIGWVHGEKGMDEMVNLQYINVDSQYRIQKFWWFPYSRDMIHGMKAGMRFLHGAGIWKRIMAIPSVLSHFTVYLLMNRKRRDKL